MTRKLIEIVVGDGGMPVVLAWGVSAESATTLHLCRPHPSMPGLYLQARCIKGRDDCGPSQRYFVSARSAILTHLRRVRERQWNARKDVAKAEAEQKASLDLLMGASQAEPARGPSTASPALA